MNRNMNKVCNLVIAFNMIEQIKSIYFTEKDHQTRFFCLLTIFIVFLEFVNL